MINLNNINKILKNLIIFPVIIFVLSGCVIWPFNYINDAMMRGKYDYYSFYAIENTMSKSKISKNFHKDSGYFLGSHILHSNKSTDDYFVFLSKKDNKLYINISSEYLKSAKFFIDYKGNKFDLDSKDDYFVCLDQVFVEEQNSCREFNNYKFLVQIDDLKSKKISINGLKLEGYIFNVYENSTKSSVYYIPKKYIDRFIKLSNK